MSKPEIILARSAGFCFGVQRAVSKVYDETDRGGDIYTYGPIIHNTEVVADLEKRGVHVVESAEEISSLKQGTVIIRSHGVSREIDTLIRESGLRCIDATCPFVKRIHRTVEAASAEGKKIVIIGNPVHPEVMGIMGWSSHPSRSSRQRRKLLNLRLPGGPRSAWLPRPLLTQINLKI